MPEAILMARRITVSLLAEVCINPLIYDLIQQLNQYIEISHYDQGEELHQ